MSDINVSTIGHRRRGSANHNNNNNNNNLNNNQNKDNNSTRTLEVVTARVLERLERDSYFFEQNPPPPLPCFEPSEVELKDELGKGEFGVVLEVSALHVMEDCPCSKCLQQQLSRDREHHQQQQQQQEDGTTTTTTSKKHRRRRRQRQKPLVMIEGMPTSSTLTLSSSSPSPHNNNNNNNNTNRAQVSSFSRGVSFADDNDTKVEEDSTVSTDHDDFDDNDDNEEEEELSLSGPEDAWQNQDDDDDDDDHHHHHLQTAANSNNDVGVVKGYMSHHLFRAGRARYAVKRLRLELESSNQLEAAIDLAGEAKFMASLNHPNICKMRGTIGQPGSWDFMIVMDCLQMTLREKMTIWQDKKSTSTSTSTSHNNNNNSNNKGASRIFRFWKRESHAHKKALKKEDVFADKLLAVYDIARAMRYLHNHQIIFRDLKPENLAFDLRGDMRLFDFGLAKELKQKDMVEAPDGFNATGLTGSRRYMAPEVILCKNYGLSADVYSYAVLVWEVFSDRIPFPNMSLDKHFERVVLKHKRPKTIKSLPKEMHNILDNAWSHERSERPPFTSICERLASQIELLNYYNTNANACNITSDRTAQLTNRSLRSRLESNDDSFVNSDEL